jgi:hypothetical protein
LATIDKTTNIICELADQGCAKSARAAVLNLGVHEKFLGGKPNFKTNKKKAILWSVGYIFDIILYLEEQFWYIFYQGVKFEKK